ncbi:uncharacterized protein LOC135331917 isoform X2 [Halichondria panicea]|uniref:uncharacterized protein LOC135331917 isoform X2 n=1 Tax=Halichondria panicea TaxID=6063 RepID=UPI00312B8038
MWKRISRRILSYQFALRSSLVLTMGKEKKSYYAVRRGRKTGVYTSWDKCQAQVNGFSGAVFKGFSTKSEAEAYAKTTGGYSAVARSTYSRARGRGRAGRYSGKDFSTEDCAIPTGGYSAGAHSRGRGRAGRHSGKDSSTKAEAKDYDIPTGRYSAVTHGRGRGRGRASDKGFSTKTEAQDYAIPTGGYSAGAHGRGRDSYSGAHTAYAEDFTSGSRSASKQTHSRCYSCGGQSSRPVVYSDGSCFGNGYGGASGGVGVFWGDNHPYNVSEKLEGHQTNQRAELVSACRALETAIQQGYSAIELKTDSTYTIKSITEWIPKWRENGWKTVTSKAVKNQEDIERLDWLCQQIDVQHMYLAIEVFMETK